MYRAFQKHYKIYKPTLHASFAYFCSLFLLSCLSLFLFYKGNAAFFPTNTTIADGNFLGYVLLYYLFSIPLTLFAVDYLLTFFVILAITMRSHAAPKQFAKKQLTLLPFSKYAHIHLFVLAVGYFISSFLRLQLFSMYAENRYADDHFLSFLYGTSLFTGVVMGYYVVFLGIGFLSIPAVYRHIQQMVAFKVTKVLFYLSMVKHSFTQPTILLFSYGFAPITLTIFAYQTPQFVLNAILTCVFFQVTLSLLHFISFYETYRHIFIDYKEEPTHLLALDIPYKNLTLSQIELLLSIRETLNDLKTSVNLEYHEWRMISYLINHKIPECTTGRKKQKKQILIEFQHTLSLLLMVKNKAPYSPLKTRIK